MVFGVILVWQFSNGEEIHVDTCTLECRGQAEPGELILFENELLAIRA